MSTGPFASGSNEITRAADIENAAENLAEKPAETLGKNAIDPADLAFSVGEALRKAGATVATAESCTGGLLSAALTDVSGSSKYFPGGVVSYANEIKEQILGVKTATLIAHGAVSSACVIEMASGARERFKTTFGVAVSGIAGPTGGTAEKPVGTVHFAVASPAGCITEKYLFAGDRGQIRRASVLAALRLLEQSIRQMESR